MSNMRAQSDQVDDNWLPSVMVVGEMSQDMLRLRALTMRLLIGAQLNGAECRQAQQLGVAARAGDQRYDRLIVLSEGKERVLFDRFKAAEQKYRHGFKVR